MFLALQTEVMDRFTAVEQHFKKAPRKSDLGQTSKGLVFVQIYAVYEYTARAATKLAIGQIAAKSHVFAALSPSLLALFLDAELQSLRDVSEAKVWEARIRLFEKGLSDATITAVETIPFDGTHYRHSHLKIIFRTLGIKKAITMRKRHLFSIDEIVLNRNRIAHGEETPMEVGRRYTRQEVLHRIRLMQRICLRLIFLMSDHCADSNRHIK